MRRKQQRKPELNYAFCFERFHMFAVIILRLLLSVGKLNVSLSFEKLMDTRYTRARLESKPFTAHHVGERKRYFSREREKEHSTVIQTTLPAAKVKDYKG